MNKNHFSTNGTHKIILFTLESFIEITFKTL